MLRWVASTFCVALLGLISQPVRAQSFNQFIGFGDSSIDSGWWAGALAVPPRCDSVAVPCTTGNPLQDALIRNALANGGAGAPVGVGFINSQILASYFGLTALPANQPGGTNYAIGGALDNRNAANGFAGNLNPNHNLPSTVQQIANYLSANGGRANPNGLYLISSGANDLGLALTILPVAAQQPYMASQAAALSASVATLTSAGARYIVVPNVYAAVPLVTFYNQTLWSDLHAAGVPFIPADIKPMVDTVIANPTAFGFTAATVLPGVVGPSTGSACVTPIGAPATTSGWGSTCANTTTPSSSFAYLRSANSEQTSFFSDNEHLSAAGQKIEADYFYSLIVAPSQISFLPEVAVKTRAGVINAILNQIPLSWDHQSPTGLNAWITGDVASLRMDNFPGFPGDPGTPIAVSAGFDYRVRPGWLIGAALSTGTTKQSFSTTGNFTQDVFAASLYTAYLTGPFWADVIASAGAQHNDVNRLVPIGITIQPNSGSTSGSDYSLASEIGYRFFDGKFTHGPVVGIALQRVGVDGFTESGSFTSLSFDEQNRNSAVSEIGYQASYDAGQFRPFAKAVWNHELASTDRDVTAHLTTIAAPSFSLPAVAFGKDWGTASVGTSVRISNRVSGLAAFTGQFAQQGVTNYGGQLGVNIALGSVASDMPVKAVRH